MFLRIDQDKELGSSLYQDGAWGCVIYEFSTQLGNTPRSVRQLADGSPLFLEGSFTWVGKNKWSHGSKKLLF